MYDDNSCVVDYYSSTRVTKLHDFFITCYFIYSLHFQCNGLYYNDDNSKEIPASI